jgi:N-acetylglucosaminyldiphosphoundecaprenol N-acetyl-beta-D-mannosaminyltransferase
MLLKPDDHMNMLEYKFVDTLGYRVFSDDLGKIPFEGRRGRVLNTISPNSYGIATEDPVFDSALKQSDYLTLDGVYFAFSSMLLQGKNIKANQGPDVFYHYMKRLDEAKGKAFFLGSTQETLAKIEQRASRDYPGLNIDSYSPPFTPEFSEEDDNEMINRINSYKPDVVFIGMTCPKQEKWAIKNRKKIDAGLIIAIGNVFDWYAGTQKAIHPFWFKVKLGWLIRIFLRPEIFRRNIGNQMKFFLHVVLIFLRLKRNPAHSAA